MVVFNRNHDPHWFNALPNYDHNNNDACLDVNTGSAFKTNRQYGVTKTHNSMKIQNRSETLPSTKI